ncbi:MAG: right-handed parallel beta-helix repeat-containing protein [Phycisphaerales bacterium]|nr:right-handed parallel beta-helix repeat-containing protein [Phycisphaerales bacterium]
MHICSLTAIVVLAVTSLASAETHTIEIGGEENSFVVAPGDTVIFQGGCLTSVNSGQPCIADGVFSGAIYPPLCNPFTWEVPQFTWAELPFYAVQIGGDGTPADCDTAWTGHISVTTGGITIQVPDDYATIQAAINAADDGDTISIVAGTYIEHDLSLGSKGIRITGETDADGNPAVTIDAQQQGRVMSINGESASGFVPLIQNIVFTGGSSPVAGGGLNCTTSNAIIRNCHFIDNWCGGRGGGVYHTGQSGGPPPGQPVSARFVQCLFAGNTADEGGGIYGRLGVPELVSCIVTDNSATVGGGINQCSCKYAVMSVGDTIVCGNSPDQAVGHVALDALSCTTPWCDDTDGDGQPDGCLYDNDGILHVPDEYATIALALQNVADGNTIALAAGTYLLEEAQELYISEISITISGETGPDGLPATIIDGQGGAFGIQVVRGDGTTIIENLHLTRCVYPLSLILCSATVTNCTIDTCIGYYGVVSMTSSVVTLNTCTVTGNQGTFGGGLIVIDQGGQSSEVALIDCVIEDNIGAYPVYAIGGVGVYTGQAMLTGCTVRNNTSGGIAGIYVAAEATMTMATTAVCGNVGYEGDTTQISGEYTDDGGNDVEVDCPEDCVGDFDGTGDIGVDDLLTLLAAYQSNGNGDCDGDGDTDVDDLLILIGVWGPCNA